MQKIKIVFIWQSLVVSAYRSFFYKLSTYWQQCSDHQNNVSIGIVTPESFVEMASQEKKADPFSLPFKSSSQKHWAITLPTKVLHTQFVYYKGLYGKLKGFYFNQDSRDKSHKENDFLFAMSEPYAYTSLFIWMTHFLLFRRKGYFFCFALQNIYKEFPFYIRWVQTFLFRRVSGILVLGREHEQVLRKHGYKGLCIPFPLWYASDLFKIEDRSQCKSKLNLRDSELEKRIVLGFSGSMIEEKGIFDLISCLSLHYDESELVKMTLLLCGKGKEEKRVQTELRALEKKGLKVHYMGGLNPENMVNFLGLVDILIVPSKTASHWKEQFGRIIVEGMACGCTVIGSDSGEIPVVIDEKDQIFKEGDLLAMKKVLDHVISRISSHDQEHLRHLNHKKVAAKYSDVVLAESFAREIDQFLKKNSFS